MSEEKREGPATELSYKATVNQISDVGEEIRRVVEKIERSNGQATEEDRTYLTDLEEDLNELEAHKDHLERQALLQRVSVVDKRPLESHKGHTPADLDDDPIGEPESIKDANRFSNPWNLDEVRRLGAPSEIASEYRARALSAIEKMSGTNDKRRETMTDLIESADSGDGKLARQLLISSSPDYMRAFTKMASGRSHNLTASEQRAMSLTDTSGGYLVPFQLDPTVIITSDGSFNEIRNISRKVVATGDVWNGVSSGSVDWSFDAEASEVSDDSTTFAQPSITIYTARGFVPISHEALMDEQNVSAEVGRLLSFGKDTLEATQFATGSGSAPQGIVTALQGAAPPVVAAVTNDAFVAEDVYALDEALPARYRFRARWLANRAIYNDIRQFDTSGGGALWERLANDVPANLLGRPAHEAEAMDGAIATGDDYVLIFGDFDNYVIADRIGTTVQFIPHLFHTTTNRPSGQSGWYAFYRVGADSVNDGAFRMLRV